MCFIKDDPVPVDTEHGTQNFVQLDPKRIIVAVILLKKFPEDIIAWVLRKHFFVCDNAEFSQLSKVVKCK